MTTTALGKVPLDAITEQARQVRPGRTVLTVIAAVLFGLGWVTARVFAVTWLAVMWCGVAVREGWRASHGPSRKAQLEAQAAQIANLKTELGRFRGI
jgi:membrane protein required for beta-lactamase induction